MGRLSWGSQWFIKKMFRKMGVEIARYYPPTGEYARCHPYAYETYVPWREERFLTQYAKVADRSTVTEDRSYILCQLAGQCLNVEGDFAECGVYRGASSYLLGSLMAEDRRALHLFDTFEGMPDGVGEDPSGHASGDFGDTSLVQVQNFLKPFDFIQFHPGVIPQSLQQVAGHKFSFVHVDVDLYRSVLDCCQFFYSRLAKGGIMLFDDYGFRQYKLSARKAVDEFFADKTEKPISIHSGQSFIIKV